MERHHVGKLNTRGDSTGYPPWVHFFLLWQKVLARVGDWSKEQMNKVKQCGEATFMLGAVIMDCRGLVDPQNKPFGNVLPLEMQVKIMFWVHCFYTMDKRKKVVQEFKGLRFDRLATTSERRSTLEPSGGAVACAPEKWLPPLPSFDGSPVVGE